MTDFYYVLGNPVEHSLSPRIHARFAELTQQDLRYDKHLVPVAAFSTHLQQLITNNMRGCNVTVPFKLEAFCAADVCSERAQLAQAANTLSITNGRISADNTDGLGLVRDIEHNLKWPLAGLRVLLLGAGGASAGVLGPLLLTQPKELVLANRTLAKAQELVERHQHTASLKEILQKTKLTSNSIQGLQGYFDVIINATTASLSGHEIALNPQVVTPQTLIYDMMYGPKTQGFAAWAYAAGGHFSDGLGMLVEQAAAAFAIWRGMYPPAAQVLAELRANQIE